ncbi:TAR DNA-binding protein 43-like [Pectinophora gossypiella]|uniref:TAR DNA-binding protein 43-like n=1 Tax=Pectinophora gossypiella TaxID=13191 RepID=UPI00214EF43D|nr:TAR DNA-binding protein 43-like [Pectinophora gossypiella]
MSGEYALVSESEHDEPIELPCEEDGSLLLSTLAAQFAGASGLKYRCGGRLRGLRLTDGALRPPPDGWAAHRYFCAFPRRSPPLSPTPRPRPSDLIVLGLPWRTSEDAVRDYFASFGELLMVQVKRDARTGLSKGFGFIKFAEHEAQVRALSRRHMIDGRWCDVRIPNSKEAGAAQRKVFVGRCTEALTADDLREYFAAFGQVTDVFVPKPFRAFSFVTFLDPEVAQSLCGQDHIIKGVSVNISTASPKRAGAASAGGAGPGGGGSGGRWGLERGARLLGWAACGDWGLPQQQPHAPLAHAPQDKPYLKYE